jgi:hypothetical protein
MKQNYTLPHLSKRAAAALFTYGASGKKMESVVDVAD